MSNLLKTDNIELIEENFRGVSSERTKLTLEERSKFSTAEETLLSVIYSPDKADSTYLVFFKTGVASQEFINSNPFIDQNNSISGRLVVLNKPVPAGKDILSFAEIILGEIERLSLKRITLIGIESGASVVQALAILDPRLFRRAVLIDPQSRVNPSFGTKVIDWIEQFLPVGLPFRAATKDFDSRPFLHRIRCPIMVLQSPNEDFYLERESTYIANKIPNSYLVKTKTQSFNDSDSKFSEEFLELLKTFQASPAKRPQKNL